MATATATARKIAVLETMAAEAVRHCEAIAGERAEIEARLGRVRLLTDPNLRLVADIPTPSEAEVWAAMAERGTLEQQAAALRVRALEASRRRDQAHAAMRDVRLAALAPRERELVQRLYQALVAARPLVDQLVALEDEKAAFGGTGFERHSAAWCALATSARPDVFVSGLDTWARNLKTYGIDVENE